LRIAAKPYRISQIASNNTPILFVSFIAGFSHRASRDPTSSAACSVALAGRRVWVKRLQGEPSLPPIRIPGSVNPCSIYRFALAKCFSEREPMN
jgi:hypothetical protein